MLAGYGDPRDIVAIESSALGIYSAPLDAQGVGAFTHLTSEAVSCLAWTPTGLYVCATDFEVGFQLGFRADAELGGGLQSFEPLLALSDVVGPQACGPGTTGAQCLDDWSTTCAAFGANCNLAGTGGSATGGAAGSGGAAAGAGGASPTASAAPASSSSCACSEAPRGAGTRALVMALAAALSLGIRRRRGRAASV